MVDAVRENVFVSLKDFVFKRGLRNGTKKQLL